MIDNDLRQRARRLLAGENRTEDLDRIFLGLRARVSGSPCFREVGDFVAHRDQRDRGLLTEIGRHVFTSIDVWSLPLRGRQPTLADVERAAKANLFLVSDEQLRAGCRCARQTANNKMSKALRKLSQGHDLKDSERRVLEYLGNRFVWKPAFTSDRLHAEFIDALLRHDIVDSSERDQLEGCRKFLSLYTVALMHGGLIEFENGSTARLYAGFANRDTLLEVKVEIRFDELEKPIFAPVCLFLTDLQPEGNCDPELVERAGEVLVFNSWNSPIEVGRHGRLCLL